MNFLIKKFTQILGFLFLTMLFGTTIASASTVNIAPASSLNTGLVGLWSFDGKDMLGGKAYDRSGLGNNGTLSGIATSTFYTMGKIGQALNFDGVNDYIQIDNINSSITTEATFSAWVKLSSHTPSTNGGWNWNTSSAADHYPFNDGSIYAGTFKATRVSVGAGIVTNRSQWHLLTITSTPGAGGWKIYQNGTLVTTATGDDTISLSTSPIIGKNSAGNQISGIIDDVRLYNRALSQSEITRLYNMGAPGKINAVSTPVPTLNTGLIGLWSFDGKDMLGGKAYDRSGLGNNCTASGIATSTFYTLGRIGQALNFDGTNDYLNCGTPASLTFTKDSLFTMSAWIKYTDAAENNCIAGKYNSTLGVGYFWCAINPTGQIYMQVQGDTSGKYIYRIGTAKVSDGRWHHVVGTYSGTSNASTGIKIYVDGVEDAYSDTQTVGTLASIAVASDFVIGARGDVGAQPLPFQGVIDEHRVYNRVLSLAEIKRLYSMGATSKTMPKLPLDQVPGASLAFSLRKLSSSYQGYAIKVRRSSDSTESDIGFVDSPLGKSLDTGTLSTFCASTDCFVKTWYDQSGNGRNVTQTTTSAQPQIVSSGSIFVGSSTPARPTVLFDGSSDFFTYTSFTVPSAVTFTGTLKSNSFSHEQRIFSGTSGTAEWAIETTGKNRLSRLAVNNAYSTNSIGSGWVVLASNSTGAAQLFRKNGVSDGFTALAQAYNNSMSTFCYQNGSNDWCNSYISEVYMYPTALSTTSIQKLELNQNAYYKVY